jgi:DNA-binding winged helix-turn-helix (wHTH) protein/tetratricopeptide (TPR) repeat protein
MNYAPNINSGKTGRSSGRISKPRGIYQFGPFRFSKESAELLKNGKKIPLKVQSAKVLGILLENHRKLVTREQLIREIWPDRTVEFDLSLNSCLRDIRHALGENPKHPRFIETLPKRGYRFSAEVSLVTPHFPFWFNTPFSRAALGVTLVFGLALIFVGNQTGIFNAPRANIPVPVAIEAEARTLVLAGVSEIYDNEVPRTEEALVLFAEAIEVDPTYTEAHLLIARTLFSRGVPGDGEKVLAALDSVLALDPYNLEATAMTGNLKWTIFHDWQGARESFERVLTIDPQNAGAYLALARIFALEGDFDTSLSQVDLALSLNTINLTQNGSVGWYYYLAGRFEEGIKFCQETQAVNPNDGKTQRCFLNNLMALGRIEEAAPYALSYMKSAGIDEAELARLENAEPEEILGSFYNFERNQGMEEKSRFDPSKIYQAMALASEGDKEGALAVLKGAYEDRNYYLPLIGIIPAFKPLRDEPGFEALAKAMNLPTLPQNS